MSIGIVEAPRVHEPVIHRILGLAAAGIHRPSNQLAGGCSNHYIKACVATRIPACYSTAWDQTCVDSVETLRCGTCPE